MFKFLTERRPIRLALVFAAPVLLFTSCGRQPLKKSIPYYVSNDAASGRHYGLVEHATATLPLQGNAWAIRSNQDTLVVAIEDRVYASTNRGDDWQLLTTFPLAGDRANIGFTEKGQLLEFTTSGEVFAWQNGSWSKIKPPLLASFHDGTRLSISDNDVPFPCANDYKYSFGFQFWKLAEATKQSVISSQLIHPSPDEIKKQTEADTKEEIAKIQGMRKADTANLFGSVRDIYSLGEAQYVNASKGFFRCYVRNMLPATGDPTSDDKLKQVLEGPTVEKLPAVTINGHVSALMASKQGLFIGDEKGEVFLASMDGKQSQLAFKLKSNDSITAIASAAPDVIVAFRDSLERLSNTTNGWSSTPNNLPTPPYSSRVLSTDQTISEDSIRDATSINGSVFVASRGQIFRLDSAKSNWQPSANGLRANIESFASTPGGLILASAGDGRLYTSRAQGAVWDPPISSFFVTSEDPDIYRSRENLERWETTAHGRGYSAIGGISAIHSNGKLLFGSFQYGNLTVSTDDGQSWKASKGPGNKSVLSEKADVATIGNSAFVVTDDGHLLRSEDEGFT